MNYTQSIPLFQVGSQGWKNPQPNPALIQTAKSSPTEKKKQKLRTKDIELFTGFSSIQLRQKVPIGQYLKFNAYLILHQGRDNWEVYHQTVI